MADFIKVPVVPLPERMPEPVIPADELFFTDEEKQRIARWAERARTATRARRRSPSLG